MNAGVYSHLMPMVKESREAAIARPSLSHEEVSEILSRPTLPRTLPSTNQADDPESAAADANLEPDFMSRSLESFVALASNANPYVPAPLGASSSAAEIAGVGPSPGSSIRARKQAKRLASELPGGAATPVPKRKRAREEEKEEVQVERDLKGDGTFLDTL